MLYFLVALVALTAIRQWNSPLFGPRAVTHYSDDSDSIYPHHGYHITMTCTMYDPFHNAVLTLDRNLLATIWHLYHVPAGRETHTSNTGCMTHNAGCMTHNA